MMGAGRVVTRASGSRTRKPGEDPANFGFPRTFKKPGEQLSLAVHRDNFQCYLNDLRMEMRRCLDLSEKARDVYNLLKRAYEEEKLLSTDTVDSRLKASHEAQKAVSDSALYDRWAAKYAEVLQAEIAYATFMDWGK